MASSFTTFLDCTQRRTTVGRTPMEEWTARRRDLYLTTHDTHNRKTSMPPVGFEPTTSAGERPQTHALGRAANGPAKRNCLPQPISGFKKDWSYHHLYILLLCTISGKDSRLGTAQLIISEVTPRSHNRDSAYCLLSEDGDPIRDNQQNFIVFCKFVGPLTQEVHTTGSAGVISTPVCQSLTIYKNYYSVRY